MGKHVPPPPPRRRAPLRYANPWDAAEMASGVVPVPPRAYAAVLAERGLSDVSKVPLTTEPLRDA